MIETATRSRVVTSRYGNRSISLPPALNLIRSPKWAICAMIMQILKERRLENWASAFKVTSFKLHTLYANALFEGEVWYRPDSPEPIALFDP